MALPNLHTAAVGSPITRLNVSFFPVYLQGNELPAINTGDDSGVLVDELEAESVQTLQVNNPTDKPVLIIEGQHFIGGKQNRSVNVTVLVAALSKLAIPVSCLERGRWGRRQAWRLADSYAPNRIRMKQREGVFKSLKRDGSRSGDQGSVWEEVDTMLYEGRIASNTAAASDLEQKLYREPSHEKAVKELIERGPLPQQCGIAVAYGSRVTALDLFGAPHLLAAHWGRLIRSYYVESMESEGQPSANQVLKLIRRFDGASAEQTPGVGLGIEHRVADKRLNGQALTLNGAIVHAAFSREFRYEE